MGRDGLNVLIMVCRAVDWLDGWMIHCSLEWRLAVCGDEMDEGI